MGASRRVVRWLRYGLPLRFKRSVIHHHDFPPLTVSPSSKLVTQYQDLEKQNALNEIVSDLLSKQCIREMESSELGFHSRVFLVPKKSGSYRLVIDLSTLNTYLAEVTFTMDTMAHVRKTAKAGMWATSLDLSDAYHHIPMHPSAHKYLCFQVGKRRFCFLVLPFGLSSAPWAFTEVVKQVKVWTAANLITLFQYLDDWLHVHRTFELASEWTQRLLVLCRELGLQVNHKKSEIVPVQRITFLGDQIDLVRGLIIPTVERQRSVRRAIDRMLELKGVWFKEAESLVGLLTATHHSYPLGRLHTRALQREVIRIVRRDRVNVWIPLSPAILHDAQWWLDPQKWQQGLPFLPPPTTETIFTDASKSGWGVVHRDRSWQGQWTRTTPHINWLELRAVLVAVQLLRQKLQGKSVLILIDNSTAVSYLRNQGGTHSRSLTKLTRRIFQLAHRWKISLIPQHIAGQLNVLADLASRAGQVIPSEWAVSESLFQWIQQQVPWKELAIDFFANSRNHRLPKYVSPCPDPQAWAVDALSCAIPRVPIYAFPPACVLSAFLQRLGGLGEYRVALLALWNPQAKVSSLLMSLPIVRKVEVPLPLRQLRQPHWEYSHPAPQQLQLTLFCLQRRA